MIVVYVAGPYRGKTSWDIENNIRRAEEIAYELWIRGVAAICPHTNCRFFQGIAPDATLLEGTMEMLRRCDGVIFLPGWQLSEGSVLEHTEARSLKMPIFYNITDVERYYGATRYLTPV